MTIGLLILVMMLLMFVAMYNRWGQMVIPQQYELCDEVTGDYCWNGKSISENEFALMVYIIILLLLDGRNQKAHLIFSGN